MFLSTVVVEFDDDYRKSSHNAKTLSSVFVPYTFVKTFGTQLSFSIPKSHFRSRLTVTVGYRLFGLRRGEVYVLSGLFGKYDGKLPSNDVRVRMCM